MFGPRITTVFRSRWRAVWFVLSVLAGAYWSVPRQGEDDSADQKAAAEAVATMMGQPQPAGQSDHHVNPWAKTAH